jgi:hypothetical protein
VTIDVYDKDFLGLSQPVFTIKDARTSLITDKALDDSFGIKMFMFYTGSDESG